MPYSCWMMATSQRDSTAAALRTDAASPLTSSPATGRRGRSRTVAVIDADDVDVVARACSRPRSNAAAKVASPHSFGG